MKKADVKMTVLNPTVPEARKITQEDVWGQWEGSNLLSRGMIVAQGWPGKPSGPEYQEWKKKTRVTTFCPIWKDQLPYKSVTVICGADQEKEVVYWLEYVHGGGSVEKIKKLRDGKIAIRSNYQCW